MDGSLLRVAFDHHTWATGRIIDVCAGLDDEGLRTNVPGTRGPIIETLRHLVEGHATDLAWLTGEIDGPDLEHADLSTLRNVNERSGAEWSAYLSRSLDPDEDVLEVDPNDGFQRNAPIGFRLAGALQHGADHRSQICTALTTLGVEPPRIDVMDFGVTVGRVVEGWPDR
jgi:uncharacterized damage-inducible protein DinB